MEHRAKKKPSSRHKTSAKTSAGNSAGKLVPQPHGGALSPGNPGNKGGTGRPPSIIRGEMRQSYDARKVFLGDVMDGKVMQKMKVRPIDLAPYVTCANCGESTIQVNKSEDAIFAELEVMVSASVRDRIAAAEHLAKFSLGQLREITVEGVREKLERQVELLRNRFSGEVLQTLERELREIWNS